MLSCPACSALTHSDRLKELARAAEAHETAGRLVEASHAWQEALDLLPPTSQQYAVIRARVGDIATRLATQPAATAIPATSSDEPWWRRGWGALITLLIFSLGKLKFLLLGLTKLSTFVSMFAFFGVYWNLYGWPLALGATFLFIFVLPIMAVMGSGASGIISVIIIGVGLRQAWRMTAGHVVTITGPYKVGGSPEATPAPTT